MMTHPIHTVVVTLIAACSVAAAASSACQTSAQDICSLNGAGVHCNPCSASEYVVCTSETVGNAQSCSGDLLWDAFSARCVDAASSPSPCLAGINIVLPQAAPSQAPTPANSPAALAPLPLPQQSMQPGWLGWASSRISNLVSSVAGQIIQYVPTILDALAPEYVPANSGRSALRNQMLGVPTLQKLQQMQSNLAKAADMHSHAVSMSQDAQLAAAVAAQDIAVAKGLLLGVAGSSSDVSEVAAAVDQAKLLLQQAAAAQQVADSIRQTADGLMSQSASEAAGVSLAISAATQQQQPMGAFGIQGPTFVGAVFDGPANQSGATVATSDVAQDADDYHHADEYDADESATPQPAQDAPARQYDPFADQSFSADYAADDESTAEGSTDAAYVTPALESTSAAKPEIAVSLAAVQQERAALLAQLNAVSTSTIGGSSSSKPGSSDADLSSSSSSAVDFSDVYDEMAVQDYVDALNDLEDYVEMMDDNLEDTYTVGTSSSNSEAPQKLRVVANTEVDLNQQQQQQQPAQQNNLAGELDSTMSAEVAAQWQQSGRKGLNGRQHISTAVAEAKHRKL